MTAATALLEQGNSQRALGCWQEALEAYERAIQVASASHDHEHLMEAVLSVAHVLRESGRLSEAEEQYHLSLTISELRANAALASRAYNGLAIVYQEYGNVESALRSYKRAVDLAEEIDDLLSLGNITQNLGTLANIRGRRDEAFRHYITALRYFQAILHEQGIAGVLNNLGMLYVDTGCHAEAYNCYRRALTICDANADLQTESVVTVNMVEMHLEMGNFESARAWCRRALKLSSLVSNDRTRADVLKLYGVLCAKEGRIGAAERFLRRAVRLARSKGNALTEAEALREYAVTLRVLDRNKEALEALYKSYEIFERLEAAHEKSDVDWHVKRLKDEFVALATSWGESLEAKDGYTKGHCQRVADYACLLAERLGVPESDLFWVKMGAFLHDVGKTQIPTHILKKTGALTDCERQLIESHTLLGEQMLAHIAFPWDLRSMIRSHHERWDGHGYPDGLSGEEIPLTARIISYADVFDALTTVRCYRGPMTFSEAVTTMKRDVGLLDPAIFPVFEELLPTFAQIRGESLSGALTDIPAAVVIGD